MSRWPIFWWHFRSAVDDKNYPDGEKNAWKSAPDTSHGGRNFEQNFELYESLSDKMTWLIGVRYRAAVAFRTRWVDSISSRLSCDNFFGAGFLPTLPHANSRKEHFQYLSRGDWVGFAVFSFSATWSPSCRERKYLVLVNHIEKLFRHANEI